MTETWWLRHENARKDTYDKAQLAANNGGRIQRICVPKDPDNPKHSGVETVKHDGTWWAVETVLEPQPVRQNAGFARVERVV